MNFLKTRAFPSFFQDYAPKLIEFFGTWVDWLTEKDNAGYIIDKLSSETDIDESVEAYKTHLKNKLLNDYPDYIASDLKLLLKNIFYFYNSKSSIKAYDFLFRCLFNSSARIQYPKENILRTSDGRWNVPKYISTSGYDLFQNLKEYNSYMIIGDTSKATAYLNGGTVYVYTQEDGSYATRNSIKLASVNGKFISGEHLTIKNPETDEIITIPELQVEYYEESVGNWEGTKGFLNSDMVIQDSHYYQDFSYIIRSNVSIHRWRKIVKSIIHPAGLEFFGDLLLSDDDDGITDVFVNPTDFLRYWHIIFKMYLFEVSAKMEFHTWTQSLNVLAQRHSETIDAWLYYGIYHAKDGFDRFEISNMNNYFNRSSVLMFRDDGTLVHPRIVEWPTFSFTKEVETNFLYGLTLHPQSHVMYGTINGNSWKPEYDESFIQNNFMIFITDKSSVQNSLVKSFVLDNEYLKFEDEETSKNYLVRETYLRDKALKYPEELTTWKQLTTKDYIATNKEDKQFYDENSLLKIPDAFISSDKNKYYIENTSYDNEEIVVYSYSPRDFTHRIFINRDNNKVDIYYTNFSWYEVKNPKEPILDSNLHVNEKTYASSSDFFTEIYECESKSYDEEGNEVSLQQTQYTLQLPYNVSKENVILFVNGLYSTNFKIKNNIVFIDTEDDEREIFCYIQQNGTITSDKAGNNFLFLLDEKHVFYDDDDVKYFVQKSGFVTRDYIGENIQYRVPTYRNIKDLNGNTILYLQENDTITKDTKGEELVYYVINNKICYDKNGKEVVFYKQENGNLTSDEAGIRKVYQIQTYRDVLSLSGNPIYYWHDNNTVTTDESGKNIVYEAKKTSLIVEGKEVKYYIQKNRTVTSDIFGKDVLFYVQPDNVITTSYILYDSSEVHFDDCTLETIVSKSETNTSKVEDLIILDEVVVELDNAITKEFGDFVLSELLYYIYGVEQTRKHSTAEMYLLSPLDATRKQTNQYSHDKHFVYNSAVLCPYTVYNTHIEHTHIVDLTEENGMSIEEVDWWIRWYKMFTAKTDMIKSRVLSLTIPAQNHSETMDSIFARKLIDMYRITNYSEEQLISKMNEHSMLVFDEDGILLPKKDIDWYNMKIKGEHEVLYSVQLLPEQVYTEYKESSADNFFIFTNGIKVLDSEKKNLLQETIIKLYNLNTTETLYKKGSVSGISTYPVLDELGNMNVEDLIKLYNGYYNNLGLSNYSTDLISSTYSMEVYYYNKDFVSEYYQNGTDQVIYLNTQGTNEVLKTKLSSLEQDSLVVMEDGNVDRLKNIEFSKIINSAYNKQLYIMTGNDTVNEKNNYRIINKEYILVFVDGKYTLDWEYRENGSLFLKKKPTVSSEVYILSPYDYNSQDMLRKDRMDTSFTFNNMRVNPYTSRETHLKTYKMLSSSTDFLFVKRQLENYRLLSQDVSFWRNYKISQTDASPNIMMHFTMDRLMRDGTYDVFPYTSSNVVFSDDEQITTNQNEISYLESKFNRYSTMLFDDKGLLINPYSIDWGITTFAIPQQTEQITVVCLNGEKPAVIGELFKTNLRSIKTAEADILLDVAMSQLDSSLMELLDTQDSVVQEPYTYETDKLENIGNTDYLYYKVSDEALDTMYALEDDFIPNNVFVFVNGKKVYKDDVIVQEQGNCYIITNYEKYKGSRLIFMDAGSLTEGVSVMNPDETYTSFNTMTSETNVLEYNEELLSQIIDNSTQESLLITQKADAKECIVFQYRPEDIAGMIEEKSPSARIFTLPEVGFKKDNLLVFVNGLETKNYYIQGNKLVFPKNIILDTVEIYIFKKYDYLFVDVNKYNDNYNNFIVKNIKRSLFF